MNTKTQKALLVAVAIAGIVALFWDKIKAFFKMRNCGSVDQWALLRVSKKSIIAKKYGYVDFGDTTPPLIPPPVNLKSNSVFISTPKTKNGGPVNIESYQPTQGKPLNTEMLEYADAEIKRYAQYFALAPCVTQFTTPKYDSNKGIVFKGPANVLREIKMKLDNENPGHGPHGTFHFDVCPDSSCTSKKGPPPN